MKRIKSLALAVMLGCSVPVVADLTVPSASVAQIQFPTGEFRGSEWSVSLWSNNGTYYYRGRNLQSGDTLQLSGANFSGNSQRVVYTWNNGAYRYSVAWRPNDPNTIRLQVFAPNGSAILNHLLTKNSTAVATQTPRQSNPSTSTSRTAQNTSIISAWRNARIIQTIEDREVSGRLVAALSVSLSRDGQTLASGGYSGTVKLWNISTGDLDAAVTSNRERINSVAISPDGRYLATLGDNLLAVWNLQTEEFLYSHLGAGTDLAISPDSQTLATGIVENSVRLWDLRSGEPRQTLPGLAQAGMSLSFSADGSRLAGGSWYPAANVWNLRTGRLERRLGETNKSYDVVSTAISPDGLTLVTSINNSSSVLLWNTRTGEVIRNLQGHSGAVNAVTISPDGQILATGSADGTIRLWNFRTRELIRTLPNNAGGVLSLSFSGDGRTLASSNQNGKLIVWQAQ